jgi:hypothetical protein
MKKLLVLTLVSLFLVGGLAQITSALNGVGGDVGTDIIVIDGPYFEPSQPPPASALQVKGSMSEGYHQESDKADSALSQFDITGPSVQSRYSTITINRIPGLTDFNPYDND